MPLVTAVATWPTVRFRHPVPLSSPETLTVDDVHGGSGVSVAEVASSAPTGKDGVMKGFPPGGVRLALGLELRARKRSIP